MEKLRLQRRDVAVTVHQPEPYLIRFERKEHCAEARDRGRFTGRGIDICLRPWRSLTHALGMRIFFRVRLCLDGIPSHAWTPDIVERVIGSKCALQSINTDLVEPRDTRHIDLWAWTADPSEIPKKVWLVFTHRPSERSSRIFISEAPPDRWHQGARFPVFIHMPLVEDYSAAANDLQGAVDNPSSITPIRRNYTWRYGIVDGSPPGTRAAFPTRLPRPPPTKDGDEARELRRDDARDATRGVHSDGAGRVVRRGDIRGARSGSQGRDAERAMGSREVRATREVRSRQHPQERRAAEQENERRRAGRYSCKEQGFTWPHGRNDDEDDDYEHPGRGRDFSLGFSFFSLNDDEPVRRERTRSPRRLDGAFWRRRPALDDHATQRTGEQDDDDDDITPAAGECGRERGSSQGAGGTQHLQGLLAAHAYASKTTTAFLLNKVSSNADSILPQIHLSAPSAQEYKEMACRFAARLGRHGDAAWSDLSTPGQEAEVPAAWAFDRIKSSLLVPTVQEVEAALDALQFGGTFHSREAVELEEGAGHRMVTPGDPGVQHPSPAGPPHAVMGLEASSTELAGSSQEGLAEQLSATHPGPDWAACDADALGRDGPGGADGLPRDANEAHDDPVGPGGDDGPEHDDDDDNSYGLDGLFCTPPPPIVAHPPSRRPRQRRTFDMTAVRRSVRLAKNPSMPAVERVQRNLCRKLGLAEDEVTPLEEVLADFITMFTGPLPEHIIAALTTIFSLEDEGADWLDEAHTQGKGSTTYWWRAVQPWSEATPTMAERFTFLHEFYA
ncbi:unnamed protein product [Urochloa humidicola]